MSAITNEESAAIEEAVMVLAKACRSIGIRSIMFSTDEESAADFARRLVRKIVRWEAPAAPAIKLSELEASTLRRLSFGEDPWCGKRGFSGLAAKYTAALGRLQEKSFITKDPDSKWARALTPAGRAYLASSKGAK